MTDNATYEIIGLIAGTLTTLSFLPQVLRAFRTRDTRAISLAMYLLFCSGVALWTVYGLLISSLSIIIANAVTLALALAVLILKIRHG